MREFIFGVMPKKTVTIHEDGRITLRVPMLKDGGIYADDIERVYHKEATLLANGEIFLSADGVNDPNTLGAPTGFLYTRAQRKEVDEFLELIEVYAEKEVSVRIVEKHSGNTPTKTNRPKWNAMKCPRCRSTNVTFMDNKRKNFSVGKAVAGTVLTGGIGSIAGFAGKKGKDRWHCTDCGNVFNKK